MPITPTTRAQVQKGKIGLKELGVSGGHRYIGGTAGLSLAIETAQLALQNYETAGGGNLVTIDRITSMTGEIILQELQAKNLAMALRATVQSEAAGAVAAEAHTAYTGTLTPLDYLRDTTAAVTPVIAVSTAHATATAYALGATILASAVVYQCTTAGTSGGSAPTFNATLGATTTDGTATWTSRGAVTMVDGTDYQTGISAIEIPSTATRFAMGLPITIAYTKNLADAVQILADSQKTYSLCFDALNEADSGIPTPVKLYKLKFSPTSGLSMKGDDFATLTLAFTVLPDTTIVGTGLSQYGVFRLAA